MSQFFCHGQSATHPMDHQKHYVSELFIRVCTSNRPDDEWYRDKPRRNRPTQVQLKYGFVKNYYNYTARDSEWQWHQLSHMQVCTLHYRPDALPVAQQTESKHWRKWLNKKKEKNSNIVTNLRLIRSVHSIPTTVEGRLHCTFLQHVFSFVALKNYKKTLQHY